METAGIHLLSQQLPVVRAGFGEVQIRFFSPPNFGLNGCLYFGWFFNRFFFAQQHVYPHVLSTYVIVIKQTVDSLFCSLLQQLFAYNSEGKSSPSEVVEHSTKPDRPGAPSKPVVKGKIHPHSVRVTWGRCLGVFSAAGVGTASLSLNERELRLIICLQVLLLQEKYSAMPRNGLFWGCSTPVLFIHFREAVTAVIIPSGFTVRLK